MYKLSKLHKGGTFWYKGQRYLVIDFLVVLGKYAHVTVEVLRIDDQVGMEFFLVGLDRAYQVGMLEILS